MQQKLDQLKAELKLIWANLCMLLPRPLPVGLAEFNEWADRIVKLSGLPATEESLKFTLATMLMHLGPQKDRVPDLFFVKSLRATAAKQVASYYFQDIKMKQQEAMKKQVAVTAEAVIDVKPN